MERLSNGTLLLILQHVPSARCGGYYEKLSLDELQPIGYVSRRFHQLITRMLWSTSQGVNISVMRNYLYAVRESPGDAHHLRLMRHLDVEDLVLMCEDLCGSGPTAMSLEEALHIFELAAPHMTLSSFYCSVNDFEAAVLTSAVRLARVVLNHDSGTLRLLVITSLVLRCLALEWDFSDLMILRLESLTIHLTESLTQCTSQAEQYLKPTASDATSRHCAWKHLSIEGPSEDGWAPVPFLVMVLSLRPALETLHLRDLLLSEVLREALTIYLKSSAASRLTSLTIAGHHKDVVDLLRAADVGKLRLQELEVRLAEPAVMDTFFEELPVMASVRVLKVHGRTSSSMDDTDPDTTLLTLCQRFPSVKNLDLSHVHLREEGWTQFLQDDALPSLTSLSLQHCSDGDSIVKALLRRAKALSNICLYHIRAMPEDLVMLLCYQYWFQGNALNICGSGLFDAESNLVKTLLTVIPGKMADRIRWSS